MPLAPAPNVPHVLSGEVVGLDGTKVWPVVAEPADRCVLWVVAGGIRCSALCVKHLHRVLRGYTTPWVSGVS